MQTMKMTTTMRPFAADLVPVVTTGTKSAAAWSQAGLLLVGALVTTALSGDAEAKVFRLANPADSVIGTPFYVKSEHEHTLLDVGRHFGHGHDEMKQTNPGVDTWIPGAGTDVLIPDFYVLPSAPREGLVINLAEKRMYYFPSPTQVETFAVGTAREGWSTPTGTFSIIEKRENPTWTPPESVRRDYAKRGEILPAVVPAGPDNPLGEFAMRLSNPSYLIHGTAKPWGVGMPVSAGCTRMYPEDIRNLFPRVPVGTTVRIVDQPYKAGWLGDGLYLEVNLPEDGSGADKPVEPVIRALVGDGGGVVVDWDEVARAKAENAGLPRLVGGRQGLGGANRLDSVF